ncbi:MAG: T9SS type A sorting domain-containing protein [Paludibacteraceae bacterium]|nr:T9SS type A sorting domain-containing protein [Paludibacteraceae bacterium]MBR4839298.1 T9SS type A sorting domain-containing protein [Paludibacteraceae bacterium]
MKHILATILMSMSLCLGNVMAQEQTDQTKSLTVSVSMADNILYVTGAPIGSEIVIMNMLGERVYQGSTKNEKESFDLNLRNGFYIVKVGNVLKRIIIK